MPGISNADQDAIADYWTMLNHIETTEGYKTA